MTEIIPKENFKVTSIENGYSIETSNTISVEKYNEIIILIKEAENEITDEITKFAKQTFTENSDSKNKMSFNICTVSFDNKIIAYGIAYVDEADGNYYIDIIFISILHRGKGISKVIIADLVSKIQQLNSVNFVKCITQEGNNRAVSLINSYNIINKQK